MSKPMTDEERQELARKLDEDLDDFIQKKIETSKGPDIETDIDKLAAELSEHPAFCTEIDLSKPLHPLVEALQQVKYESESPDYNADSYKDDGNSQFKIKRYRFAIENYTKGINLKPSGKLLNAQLYTNRAAAHYHLGNFRSSYIDCALARKFVPDHMKAILRGAQCCIDLKRVNDAIRWCNDGLAISPTDQKLLDLRAKAEKIKSQTERDRRKEAAQRRKKAMAEKALLDAIKARKVRLAPATQTDDDTENEGEDFLMLSSIETHHPSGAKVHLDSTGGLLWPVLFLYPEFKETDFISAFHEKATFADHISAMFGEEPPHWDVENAYTPGSIKVYFENTQSETLYPVDVNSTLEDILKNKHYLVTAGTPNFILLSKKSEFTENFLLKYKKG